MHKVIFAAWLLAFFLRPAAADIWECIDERGNKHFTNITSEAKGCKRLVMPPLPTVPAVKPPPASSGKTTTAPPPNFPKVDADTQRQRDTDRRRILEQELASEEKLLDQARKELTVQESIRLGSERNYQRVLDRLEPYKKKVKLHEDNIANLRREIATIR